MAEPYNFRKPSRLATDLQQGLSSWLRAGCVLATEKWAKLLPVRIEVGLEGLDTERPSDALARLPDAAAAYVVALDGADSSTLLAFPRPVALALVAGMLGESAPELPADRALTPVEESLCEYLIQHFLAALEEAWPGDKPPGMQVRQAEPNPKRIRIFAPDTNVVVCGLTLRGPLGEHAWHWIAPRPSLLEWFARGSQGQAGSQNQGDRPRLEAIVRELPVEVTVKLGAAELHVSQLASLRNGDLVILDQRVTDPLRACIAGETKFRVWPGRVGSRQAFQIESPFEC